MKDPTMILSQKLSPEGAEHKFPTLDERKFKARRERDFVPFALLRACPERGEGAGPSGVPHTCTGHLDPGRWPIGAKIRRNLVLAKRIQCSQPAKRAMSCSPRRKPWVSASHPHPLPPLPPGRERGDKGGRGHQSHGSRRGLQDTRPVQINGSGGILVWLRRSALRKGFALPADFSAFLSSAPRGRRSLPRGAEEVGACPPAPARRSLAA